MLDFLGGGWGWKNLGDVDSVVCMLPKLRSRALCERGASVEHRGVGRTAPANPSFERTPLHGCALSGRHRASALPPGEGAAQLATTLAISRLS